MKIICMIGSLGAGGAERQLTGLACFLKEAGHEVEFVIYSKDLFYKKNLDASNIHVECIDNYSNALGKLCKISSYIRKAKPDWVISFMEKPSMYALYTKLTTFGRLKVLVSKRNTNIECTYIQKLYFNLFRYADAVTTNAYGELRFWEKYFPNLVKKASVIVNFVDLDHFNSNRVTVNKTRRIIVTATVAPQKNVMGFIDAVKIAYDRKSDFVVDWYGVGSESDPFYKKCCERIETLGLRGVFNLKKKTPDIKEKYAESDIFCLPSFFEGTSNSLSEALACSMPIICSNVCENPLYVSDDNGILFDPKSSDSMADAITMMLSLSDEQLLDFGKRSREIAEEKLSKEKFIDSYLEILK